MSAVEETDGSKVRDMAWWGFLLASGGGSRYLLQWSQ